jgi:uncharacterized protein (TIGR02453 family)
MRFLRGLAKHNDRVWFEARRPTYEKHLKEPLLALVEEINGALVEFAPEHIRPPQKVAMRIFRDTRFSPDKRPYKTHLGAWWARQGLEKTSAAGFFLQVAPEGSFLAAGVYAPERDGLLLLRRWFAEHHTLYRQALQQLTQPRKGGLAFEAINANALTRNPKGFPPDHPADDLLRARNWGVLAHLPSEAALQPSLAKEIVKRLQAVAPLVNLLNEPFLNRDRPQSMFPL